MTESEKIVKILKEDLPAFHKFVNLLKDTAKKHFSLEPSSKTFKTDGGDLIHDGELAAGVDVFLMEADKKVPAATKTYTAEDGTEVVVESGKVVDIKKITPAKQEADFKAFAEELFKAFPKADFSGIEKQLADFKTQMEDAAALNKKLQEQVNAFGTFKTEVLDILGQFAKEPAEKPTGSKKTDSTKSIFSAELTPAERAKLLNETK